MGQFELVHTELTNAKRKGKEVDDLKGKGKEVGKLKSKLTTCGAFNS